MAIKTWLIGLLAMILAACSAQDAVEGMAPSDDQQLAEAAIDDLIAGRNDALAARMPAEFRQQLGAVAPQMRDLIPADPKVRLVQANWTRTAGPNGSASRQTSLTYELSGGGHYALTEIVIERVGPSATVAGFHVAPADGPVDSWSGLTLAGKGGAHYAMLAAALAAVGVTLWALVRIWRSGLFRRRWLWTIGALLGVTRLAMNWTTGEVSFHPIYVQPFSAGIVKQGIGPWQAAVGFPLVAIWALLTRRNRSSVPADAQP